MLVAILTSAAVTTLALMLAFPQTPTGKWLHRALVEAPARILSDMTWAKIGKMILVSGAIALFAFAGPEMLTLLAVTGLDAAALFELMFVVWFASVSGGIVGIRRTVARLAANVARLLRTISAPRNRSRSSRPRKPGPRPKNDDEAEPGWAFA